MGGLLEFLSYAFFNSLFENIRALYTITSIARDFRMGMGDVSGLFWFGFPFHIASVVGIIIYATKKGVSGFLAFVFCLAVPTLGAVAIVSFLANMPSVSNIITKPKPRPTSQVIGDTWLCKECEQINPLTASICKGCGIYK